MLQHSDDAGVCFPEPILRSIDETFAFTACNNAEIKQLWQRLCIRSECEWIIAPLVAFVTSVGRMKYVRPLYRELRKSRIGAKVAKETFAKFSEVYHPICRKMVKTDLDNAQALEDAAAAASTSSTSSSPHTIKKSTIIFVAVSAVLFAVGKYFK
jgi:hypothetical protein